MKEELCNCCGRTLNMSSGRTTTTEDALHIRKEWGFFSKKDLQIDSFILCEDCYDKWIKSFKLPVKKEKKQEVLC